MKSTIKIVVGLTVLMFLVSCVNPSPESRANEAFNKARNASGFEKRNLEKEAYMFYRVAIKRAHDQSRVSIRLRNRFVEATLIRANLVLQEATSTMDALDLFVEDIDSAISPDISDDLKQRYAEFLAAMADSNLAHGRMYDAVNWLDKAIEVAPQKSTIAEKKQSTVKQYVDEKFGIAQMHYDDGKKEKDNEELVRAEFYAKLALFYDPNNTEAKALLDKVRPDLVGTYTAYDAVLDEKPDTAVYRKLNNLMIHMCIPGVEGGGTSLIVNMFNYSYNPLRLRDSSFYLVDVNGGKYKALSSSKIEPEILEQQKEAQKMRLHFPKPAAEIKKLVFESNENGYQFSEKYLR
jgi:hypothetical protein